MQSTIQQLSLVIKLKFLAVAKPLLSFHDLINGSFGKRSFAQQCRAEGIRSSSLPVPWRMTGTGGHYLFSPLSCFSHRGLLFMINSIPARVKRELLRKGDPDMRRGTLSVLNACHLLDKELELKFPQKSAETSREELDIIFFYFFNNSPCPVLS